MKRHGLSLLLCLVFVVMSLTGAAFQVNANANDPGDGAAAVTSADLITLVESYAAEGQLASEHTVRALTMHLTAVKHYEQQDQKDKVIEHLNSFKLLLNHQQDLEMMTEQAYNSLMSHTEDVILEWHVVLIINDGVAQAVIVVASDVSDQIQAAAEELAEYVSKSAGADLPILTSEDEMSEELIPIYVGLPAPGEEAHMTDQLDGLLEDGYVIHPTEHSITIMGPQELGTQYGVYEFLERYVGVRWLMPGELGEDVPQLTDLEIPIQDVRDEPVYLSRNMYPLHFEGAGANLPLRYEWGVHNRLRNQNNGWTHNVYNIFPPSQYLDEHPEFYPHPDGLEGEPLVPTPHSRWQPCFSNEDTIPIAVDYVLNYFARNPDVPSFSLAVNDSGNFCEQYPTHENYTSDRNSLGLPHMSEIYFAWVNEVVEQVLEVYPDKWFGVLAYQQVYDPPSFPLHERVVPYLTKDRLAWGDEIVRAEDQAIVDAWNEKASNIGFYDYIYSQPYMLPRVYNHLMADVFEYGADNNVVAFFGEHNPNWGDGPKSWLYLKLLWDPYQDVEALEQEWYERAVGEEAAPHLKAYYDHWRDFWENRVHETDWFQSRKRIVYFLPNSAAYLSIVTDEEIAQSRAWLETAVAKASTDKEIARAEIILKQFEYYEASALSFPKPVEPLTHSEDALALLEESVNYQEKMDYAEKRLDLIEEFDGDSIHHHTSTPQRHNMVWSGLNAEAFWELVNYMSEYETEGGPVRERAAYLVENGEAEGIRNYSQLLLRTVDEGPVNLNASFEEPTEEDNDFVTAKHWNANINSYGKFERKEERPYSGDASIYLHDFYAGDINQTVDVKPGLIITQLKYFVTADTQTVGTVWLELNLLDEEGNTLTTIQTDQQAFSSSLGRWATIEIMDKVPARINGVPVSQVRMAAIINGFHEGGTMYLDDFELYQANDPFDVPYIHSAEADNGFLDIVFNKTLEHDPIASDFDIWQLSGEEPVQVSPEVTWSADTMTATLSLPEVPLQPWAQSVQYEVNYADLDHMTTNGITIPALPGHTQLLTNHSFENWTGKFPDGWIFLAEAFSRSNEMSYSGESSLVANGLSPQENAADGSGPVTTVTGITPGQYIGVYRFLTESDADGTLHFGIQLKDEAGSIIYPTISSERTETKTSNGQWKTVTFEFEVEETRNGRIVDGLTMLVLLQGLERGNTIYLDDIELIRLPEEQPFLASAEAMENNQVEVIFNKMPQSVPTAADFDVWQYDEQETVLIEPVIEWDENNLIATLTVPDVQQKPWSQKVHYEMSYNGEELITSNAIDIARLEGHTQLLTNNSFEHWTGNFPDGWKFLAEAFRQSYQVSRSGQSSTVSNGLTPQEIAASGSGPGQESIGEIVPGKYIGVYRFLTDSEADGQLHFFMRMRDANGSSISPTISSERVDTKTSNGKWRTVTFEFEIGETYNNRVVDSLNMYVLLRDLPRGNTIYLDDLELIRVD